MEYTRNCPNCQKIQKYSTKYILQRCIKRKTVCCSCHNRRRAAKPGERQRMSDRMKGKLVGSRNPFWGKKHSAATKQLIKERTPVKRGKDNHMFGQTLYGVWLKKYGKEEADKKHLTYRKKQSKNNRGKKNFWYGKSPPMGVGYGWKGYYKNHFFRSLRELTQMYNMDQKGLHWESAEKQEYTIYFKFYGQNKSYRPDFLVNKKILIECKPKRLINSRLVKSKTRAAIRFCAKNNLEYQIFDPGLLSDIKIKELYDNKIIIFENRYEKMYKEPYCK